MNFERRRIDYITKDNVINELRHVANLLGNKSFGLREFDKNSVNCKHTKVLSFFGKWEAALAEVGITFVPERKPRKDRATDEELVYEIARVWKQLGHRPSRSEWESVETKFGCSTIWQRFEGWINACNEAYPFVQMDLVTTDRPELNRPTAITAKSQAVDVIQQIDKRIIPLRIRLRVLKRDHFKCVLCGRNPATNSKVELHIDHIIPFSKEGKTIEENLRTLCRDCNLGKGNSDEFI